MKIWTWHYNNGLINVESSFFGRESPTYCFSYQIYSTPCSLSTATATIASLCNNHNQYGLTCSLQTYGQDPCSGTYKYCIFLQLLQWLDRWFMLNYKLQLYLVKRDFCLLRTWKLHITRDMSFCVSPNNCSCSPGWTYSQCEIPICYDIPANEANVCNGGGSCLSVDNCTCNNGYNGSQCKTFYCFGFNQSDSHVCSGSETCTCEIPICYDIPANEANVCNGNGTCVNKDILWNVWKDIRWSCYQASYKIFASLL